MVRKKTHFPWRKFSHHHQCRGELSSSSKEIKRTAQLTKSSSDLLRRHTLVYMHSLLLFFFPPPPPLLNVVLKATSSDVELWKSLMLGGRRRVNEDVLFYLNAYFKQPNRQHPQVLKTHPRAHTHEIKGEYYDKIVFACLPTAIHLQ